MTQESGGTVLGRLLHDSGGNRWIDVYGSTDRASRRLSASSPLYFNSDTHGGLDGLHRYFGVSPSIQVSSLAPTECPGVVLPSMKAGRHDYRSEFYRGAVSYVRSDSETTCASTMMESEESPSGTSRDEISGVSISHRRSSSLYPSILNDRCFAPLTASVSTPAIVVEPRAWTPASRPVDSARAYVIGTDRSGPGLQYGDLLLAAIHSSRVLASIEGRSPAVECDDASEEESQSGMFVDTSHDSASSKSDRLTVHSIGQSSIHTTRHTSHRSRVVSTEHTLGEGVRGHLATDRTSVSSTIFALTPEEIREEVEEDRRRIDAEVATHCPMEVDTIERTVYRYPNIYDPVKVAFDLLIRAAVNGWSMILDRILSSCLFDPTPALVAACINDREEVIASLLAHTDPSDGKALRRAVAAGHVGVIKKLLADGRSSRKKTVAIAVARGRHSVLRVLLDDPRAEVTFRAFLIAVEKNDEIATFLLVIDQRVDISAGNNAAFRLAISRGYHGIVRLLIHDPRVDPSDVGNEAFSIAIRRACSSGTAGDIGIIKALLLDLRIDPIGPAFLFAIAADRKDIVRLIIEQPGMTARIDLYLDEIADRKCSIHQTVLNRGLIDSIIAYLNALIDR